MSIIDLSQFNHDVFHKWMWKLEKAFKNPWWRWFQRKVLFDNHCEFLSYKIWHLNCDFLRSLRCVVEWQFHFIIFFSRAPTYCKLYAQDRIRVNSKLIKHNCFKRIFVFVTRTLFRPFHSHFKLFNFKS
jgi:hypothetical protein